MDESKLLERITANPRIFAGKPIIRGTRLSVEFIVGLLAQGWSQAEVLEQYDLKPDDIQACLAYAGDVLREESVFPLGA